MKELNKNELNPGLVQSTVDVVSNSGGFDYFNTGLAIIGITVTVLSIYFIVTSCGVSAPLSASTLPTESYVGLLAMLRPLNPNIIPLWHFLKASQKNIIGDNLSTNIDDASLVELVDIVAKTIT